MVIKEPVAKEGNSYLGEVKAIELATKFALNHSSIYNHSTIHIFSDCRSAIQSVSTTKIHRSYQSTIDKTLSNVSELVKTGISTEIHWVAGHVDLAPNEAADKEAKNAAYQAMLLDSGTITVNTVKQKLKTQSLKRWQQHWDNSETGRSLHEVTPKVPKTMYKSVTNKSKERKYLRCKSGETRLKDNMFRIKLAESPNCELCSKDRETVEHVLLYCEALQESRNHLVNRIDEIYCKQETPVEERTLTIRTLLHPNHSSPITRNMIRVAAMDYINSIPLSI